MMNGVVDGRPLRRIQQLTRRRIHVGFLGGIVRAQDVQHRRQRLGAQSGIDQLSLDHVVLTIEPFDVIRTHGETKLRKHSRLLTAPRGAARHRQDFSHEAA